MRGRFKYLNDIFPTLPYGSWNPYPYIYLHPEKEPLSGGASPLIYSEHVRAKMIKVNKCLLQFVLRSLRKEGFSQVEVDRLFSALVLPNFTYGLSVYEAVDSDLTAIQNFLDRCLKRKYIYLRESIFENF